MKTAEKLAAGWLLILGFMFTMTSVSALIEKHNIHKPLLVSGIEFGDYPNQAAADALGNTALQGLMFGVPTTVLGAWLALGFYRQSQQEKKVLQEQTSDRLQSTFYRMIRDNKGRITLLSFAMHSQLPAANAKKYLDEQAKVFNANFKVSEEGGVYYHFDI